MHIGALGIPIRCRVALRQSIRLVVPGCGLMSLTCRHASRRCKQSEPSFQRGSRAVLAVRRQHGTDPVVYRIGVYALWEGKTPLLGVRDLEH